MKTEGIRLKKNGLRLKKLAAGGALCRLGWKHMAQEGGGKMAVEAAAGGDQGGGSTMAAG